GPGVRKTGRLLNLAPSCNVPDDRTGLRGRQKKRTSIQETQTVYDLSSYRSLFYTAILVTGRITAGMHRLFHGRSGDEIYDKHFRSSSGDDQKSIAGNELQRIDPTLSA